jgi:hypothetical protein
MCSAGLQKGGNKSGIHALGFEPVNQEQLEIFHEMATARYEETPEPTRPQFAGFNLEGEIQDHPLRHEPGAAGRTQGRLVQSSAEGTGFSSPFLALLPWEEKPGPFCREPVSLSITAYSAARSSGLSLSA